VVFSTIVGDVWADSMTSTASDLSSDSDMGCLHPATTSFYDLLFPRASRLTVINVSKVVQKRYCIERGIRSSAK
jgi:hypothetical protein